MHQEGDPGSRTVFLPYCLIVQGCRDAGLTAVKPQEALELFKSGRILSRELAGAIDGMYDVATPQMVRTIVSALVGRHASQIENGLPKPALLASPAERKTAIVDVEGVFK